MMSLKDLFRFRAHDLFMAPLINPLCLILWIIISGLNLFKVFFKRSLFSSIPFVEENFLYFNQDYEFVLYRDGKWLRVLDIMSDLGLIQNNSDKKNWEITKEGERWLMKIQ